MVLPINLGKELINNVCFIAMSSIRTTLLSYKIIHNFSEFTVTIVEAVV